MHLHLSLSIYLIIYLPIFNIIINHLSSMCLDKSVLVCSSCHNKITQARWLKHKICFLTVLDARWPRSKCQQSWFLVRPLFLPPYCFANACLLTVSSHDLSFLCAHEEQQRGLWYLLSSCKDTRPIGLRSTCMTSFNHNYLLKGPISKYNHTEF